MHQPHEGARRIHKKHRKLKKKNHIKHFQADSERVLEESKTNTRAALYRAEVVQGDSKLEARISWYVLQGELKYVRRLLHQIKWDKACRKRQWISQMFNKSSNYFLAVFCTLMIELMEI